MPRIQYEAKRFSPDTRTVIARANAILAEYESQGYDLTLRQLYYQFVSRDLLANRQSEYKRLGGIVNDARLAGLIDWDSIVDRTRFLRDVTTWDSPASILSSAADGYTTDKWASQPYRVEVWVEKDALVGVIERACDPLEVPYLSCRGYTSQTEMWGAAQRLLQYILKGQRVRVLHLGDHDPSGIDMTRDITDRLEMFIRQDFLREHWEEWHPDGEYDKAAANRLLSNVDDCFQVDRLALNMDQVEQYDPPPNPAKLTDSRSRGYVAEHGDSSWELDALPPQVLGDLISEAVLDLRDQDQWEEDAAEEEQDRWGLTATATHWDKVTSFLQTDLSDDEISDLPKGP